MTDSRISTRRAWRTPQGLRRVALGVAAVLAVGVAVLGAQTAVAATPPALQLVTSAAAAPEIQQGACSASAETACLSGTIADSGPGVVVIATGEAGEFAGETDESGRWAIAVTGSGEYEVTVDTATLPDGASLRNDDPVTRETTLGSSTAVIIAIDAPEEAPEDADGATSAPAPAPEAAQISGFDWDRFAQQAASGLRLGLLLALAAVGLSLIYGTTGISNFAHGEFVTLGGLLAYLFANVMGMNLWISAVIVVALCALFGLAQDMAIWKPLRKRNLSIPQLMIVTIGFSISLQYAFQYFIGGQTVRVDTANPTPVTFGPVSLSVTSYIAMGIAVVVLLGIALALTMTRVGRATRAVSDNPALAAAAGIDVDRVIRLVWSSSAALAGLAGVLLALVLNGVNWMTGMQLLLLMFAAVTLGGLGTAFGALVGALVIGMTVELTNIWLPGDFKYATALVLLILLLLVRPQGLLGRKERVG